MSTRKPVPYSPFDSLFPGDEIRIKRKSMTWTRGLFDGFHLDGDGVLWLKVATVNTLLWIRACEVEEFNGLPMIQRVHYVREEIAPDVYESIWSVVAGLFRFTRFL